MRNNFNFNASIKLKDLEKMKRIYEVLQQEKVENHDTMILQEFEKLLNSFDSAMPKMDILIESFYLFYENILKNYSKVNYNVKVEKFDYFDFEQIQYVMDKMKEIISLIGETYNIK